MTPEAFGFERPTKPGHYWFMSLFGDGEETAEQARVLSVEDDAAVLTPDLPKFPGLRVITGHRWIWNGREEERRQISEEATAEMCRLMMEEGYKLPPGERFVEGLPLDEFCELHGWVGILWAGPIRPPALSPDLLRNPTGRAVRFRASRPPEES